MVGQSLVGINGRGSVDGGGDVVDVATDVETESKVDSATEADAVVTAASMTDDDSADAVAVVVSVAITVAPVGAHRVRCTRPSHGTTASGGGETIPPPCRQAVRPRRAGLGATAELAVSPAVRGVSLRRLYDPRPTHRGERLPRSPCHRTTTRIIAFQRL